jgi:CDP-glucose 4,6-dehydratase
MDDASFHGEAFNFGLEKPISVIDLTMELLSLMNATDLEPQVLNQASNEIREQWLSSEKARQRLNWKPAFGLTDGLRETINWYRSRY